MRQRHCCDGGAGELQCGSPAPANLCCHLRAGACGCRNALSFMHRRLGCGLRARACGGRSGCSCNHRSLLGLCVPPFHARCPGHRPICATFIRVYRPRPTLPATIFPQPILPCPRPRRCRRIMRPPAFRRCPSPTHDSQLPRGNCRVDL